MKINEIITEGRAEHKGYFGKDGKRYTTKEECDEANIPDLEVGVQFDLCKPAGIMKERPEVHEPRLPVVELRVVDQASPYRQPRYAAGVVGSVLDLHPVDVAAVLCPQLYFRGYVCPDCALEV